MSRQFIFVSASTGDFPERESTICGSQQTCLKRSAEQLVKTAPDDFDICSLRIPTKQEEPPYRIIHRSSERSHGHSISEKERCVHFPRQSVSSICSKENMQGFTRFKGDDPDRFGDALLAAFWNSHGAGEDNLPLSQNNFSRSARYPGSSHPISIKEIPSIWDSWGRPNHSYIQ